MTRRAAAAIALLLSLAACSGGSTTDKLDYRIDEPVTALAVDVRAAAVDIVTGAGPVTVTEEYRYAGGKPATAHRVDGTTLRLTETGCGDDDVRCEVRYRIRVPAATTVDVTAQAGAVKLDGIAGTVKVATQAGAVEGRALTSDTVTIRTQMGAAELEFAEAPTLISAVSQVGAVGLRVPRTTAYAVDVRGQVGKASVKVDRDPASTHRIEVQTQVGAVQIEPLP